MSKESQYTQNQLRASGEGWIGVDLDGTLAEYHGWDNGKIGEPVQLMLARVKEMIANGATVKIFTARVSVTPDRGDRKAIQDWLETHGLPRLEVTNVKDLHMIELWDDRAIQVTPNTGVRADGSL